MRILSVMVAVLGVGLGVDVPAASAQGQGGRFEVGGQASLLRLTDFGATNVGVGGRVIVDVRRWLAIDAEGQFFPTDDILIRSRSLADADFAVAHRRRRADGFFGVKLGARRDRMGLFGRIRPGFTRLLDQGIECVGVDCARILMLFVRDDYRTEFALDLGGGAEFYPSRRTVARVEFGDTMIRHRSFAPPCWAERCTSHNFSTRVGGGVRF